VSPETDAICKALALDPLKLIGSGALLIAVAPTGTKAVLDAVQAAGVSVTAIGEVRPSSEDLTIVTGGVADPLTPPARDEIARAFGLKGVD
jgi:hydrogenase expression/formation protein HypE